VDSSIHSLSGSLPILCLYLPLMKHFLKPLGHCLTTAVMTSTMLRAYALPATEAANPESVPPQPPENSVASASESVEAPAPAEPERVEPAVEPVAVAASPAPLPALDLEAAPTASPRVSDLANPTTAVTPVPVTAKPEGPRVADLVNPRVLGAVGQTAADPKPTAPEATPAQPEAVQPNKPAAPSNTVAGMRQTLEKRLATIVERDKADREARWQQNLMLSALQAAQMGHFERARQIAQHPALPPEVQIELLAQIAAIEASVAEANATADSSGDPASAAPTDAATPATAGSKGRSVPPSYSVVNTWESAIPALPGLALPDRCLPAATPAIATQTASMAQSTATSRTIYPYVTVVGRNVAARLARLSQTAPSTPVAALPIQPVASRPGVPVPTRVSAPEPTSPSAPQSQSQWTTFFQTLPPPPASSPAPQSADRSAATTPAPPLPIATPPPAPQLPLLSAADSSVAVPLDPMAKSPKQPIASPAATRGLRLDSLVNPWEQLGLALPPSLSAPLEVALGWWAPSEPTTAAPDPSPTAASLSPVTAPEITASAADATAGTAQVLAAEVGLTNHPWLRNLEQTLPTWVGSSRDARKTVLPPALPTASASKNTLQPAAAAMPCNEPSNLSEGSYVVDPAMSKQMGWVNLMFPLPIPAAITSVFGWRVHPIFGDLRFHTGVDIGAPMGTPVMAALEGRVVAADYMGGYGLTVVIENDKVKQRNLYGHLSGIAVRPGMQVTQGSVIGWVGSTGNSTGPHLHFESLMLAEGGWTAVDPLAVAAKQIAQGQ